MIAQQGRVISVSDDGLIVRVGGTTGCSACDAGKGCGAGVFGRLLRRNPIDIEVPNEVDARVGQAVQLGIAEQRFLALVFRLYVFPLMAGLVGAALGYAIATKGGYSGWAVDALTLMLGIVLAGSGLLMARKRLQRFPIGSQVSVLQDTGNKFCDTGHQDLRGRSVQVTDRKIVKR